MIIGAMPSGGIEFPLGLVFVLVAYVVFVAGLVIAHYYWARNRSKGEDKDAAPSKDS